MVREDYMRLVVQFKCQGCDALGLGSTPFRCPDADDFELPPGWQDAAYCRWYGEWGPHCGECVAKVEEAKRVEVAKEKARVDKLAAKKAARNAAKKGKKR